MPRCRLKPFFLIPVFLICVRGAGGVAPVVAVGPGAVAGPAVVVPGRYCVVTAVAFSLSAGTMCDSCSMRAVLGRLLSAL